MYTLVSVIANLLLAAWMLLLAFVSAFSAFGTACNDCQEQIDRGWALICVLLLVVYFGTIRVAKNQSALRKTATMLAGGVVALIVTWIAILLVMPV